MLWFVFVGMFEDYQQPYHNMVSPDPHLEEMKKVVCIEKRRPDLPNRWQNLEVGSMPMVIIHTIFILGFIYFRFLLHVNGFKT